MPTTEDLLTTLNQLRTVDTALGAFGAQAHGYVLQPALSEAEVAEFEQAISVTLPAPYRDFLLNAGNGGVGPGYGLQTLAAWHCEEFSQVTSVITTKSGERFETGTGDRATLARPSDPSKPYPFTETWGAPGPDEDLPIPEGSHPFDGCLYLSDIGCGYSYLLVVTGEAAGQVWVDYTAGDGQVSKVADSFDAWYANWLDEALVDAAEKRASNTLWFSPEDPILEVVQVLDIVERWATQYPDWTGQHYLHGVLDMYNRNVDAALDNLGRAIEVSPDDLRAYVMLGRLHALLGEEAEAVAVADRALALNAIDVPNQHRLHWLRARSLLNLERVDEAIAAADQARDLHFYVFHNQIDYAIFLTVAGQTDRAAAALAEYIEAANDDQPEVFRQQVYQAMIEGCEVWNLPEAVTYYQQLVA
ncbi:MAG: SMI1/KNR4 family protein [Thermoflexales bacterium]|nr:SMI1/KNR4 family protein [Thermoflexales bacterium]